jgi:hypothetical protein
MPTTPPASIRIRPTWHALSLRATAVQFAFELSNSVTAREGNVVALWISTVALL